MIPFCDKIPIVREIKYCLKMMRLLRNMNYDIINLNSHLQISALPVLVAIRRQTPLIVTIHGVYSKTNFALDAIQKLYLYTFCRILWNKAKAIVCLTEADADEIHSYGCPKEKIEIIPNWVNIDFFKPGNNTKDRNTILWVGRFVPPKGLEYLVKAAKLVVTKFPTAKFVLVGDGPLKSDIAKKIIKEELTEFFEIKGSLPNDAVAREMADASIFAFPSLKEGMPFSILEAASSGMAIVASDIPSTRAVLKGGEHALLVKPKDPLLLADAIVRILECNELREKLQKNARKLMEDAYAMDIISKKTFDVYEDIVRKHGRLRRDRSAV
jgi:glycosyltransferase involved in cell wall biosynthesis